MLMRSDPRFCADYLSKLSLNSKERIFQGFPAADLRKIMTDWTFWARDEQLPPEEWVREGCFIWNSLAGLIFGVMLLDFGMQSAMVSNQQIIYGLKPQARNRVNNLFMVKMFVGGSLGSGGATLARKVADWQGVADSAIAVALTASLAPSLLHHNQS
jgi:hypothetical protein